MDSYKYLDMDKSISCVGLANKTSVTVEYYTRVKRISNSELSSVNKVVVHNSFKLPVLTTAVGILNWRIDRIKEIDIKTRKQLTMSRNFHPNGDIHKLYLPRGQGRRDIKMIAQMFESRIMSIAQYNEQKLKQHFRLCLSTRTARNYTTKPATTRSVSYRI